MANPTLTSSVKIVDYNRFYAFNGIISDAFLALIDTTEIVGACADISRGFSKPVFFVLKTKRQDIFACWYHDGQPFSYGQVVSQTIGQDFSFYNMFSTDDKNYCYRRQQLFIDTKHDQYRSIMKFDVLAHPLLWEHKAKEEFPYLKNIAQIMPMDRHISYIGQFNDAIFTPPEGNTANMLRSERMAISNDYDYSTGVYTEFKFIRNKEFYWFDRAINGLSRFNGPASITLNNVSQKTVNRDTSPLDFDGYSSEWVFKGHVVQIMDVINFCHQRNIVLRDPPSCIEQSAFLNIQDEMVFLTDFVSRYVNA